MDRLKNHVDSLFVGYEKSKKNKKLKAEILNNLQVKVTELIANGMDEDLAVNNAIKSIEDIDFLTDKNRVKNRKLSFTIIKYSVLVIFVIYCLTMVQHYIRHNSVLRHSEPIAVDIRADIEEFQNKEFFELYQIGFNDYEILSISNMDLNNLELGAIISTVFDVLNRPGYSDDLKEVSFSKLNKDTVEGADSVQLNVMPAAVVYSHQDNKTYYKVTYTANIKEPLFFQNEGNLIIRNNEFGYFFGYSKLHYVSENGDWFYDYSSKDFMSSKRWPNSDLLLEFDVRRKINGFNYYLKGISGVIILETYNLRDLSTYSQYTHKQIFREKAASKLWSNWILDV